MATFQVRLFAWSKRENSTKRPDEDSGVTYRVVAKERFDALHPSIILNLGLSESPVKYNYAWIPLFGRYYYITAWIFDRGCWQADLNVDVLASWKDFIGISNEYVLRASEEYDGDIIDTMYPTVADVQTTIRSIESPWATNLNDGTYVVGIINDDSGAMGAVSYYVMSPAKFKQFCTALFGSADWIGVDDTEISQNLQKALINPFQYVVSCIWVPFEVTGTSATSSLKYGWWESGVTASRLAPLPLHLETLTFTLPKHPQSASRGNYLNLSPYTKYTLNIRPFGTIPIDTTIVINSNTLYALISVDCITGAGTIGIATGTGYDTVFATSAGQVGVPIQLAQMVRSYANIQSTAVTAAVETVGNGLQAIGNWVAGLFGETESDTPTPDIGSTVQTIGNSSSAALAQLSTNGANGTISDYVYEPYLMANFYKVVTESNAHKGRPLCKVRQISELGGYIQVSDADLRIAGTSTENAMIKAYMESGFFFE